MPAKGDGITKRKDDRYMARYTVHTPEGPKRRVVYGRRYKDVENRLAEARGDAARGITYDPGSRPSSSTLHGGSLIASEIRYVDGPTSATRA